MKGIDSSHVKRLDRTRSAGFLLSRNRRGKPEPRDGKGRDNLLGELTKVCSQP
jgi:hypothetical protein